MAEPNPEKNRIGGGGRAPPPRIRGRCLGVGVWEGGSTAPDLSFSSPRALPAVDPREERETRERVEVEKIRLTCGAHCHVFIFFLSRMPPKRHCR